MDIKFELEDDMTDLILNATEDQIARALEKIGLQAEKYSKIACPVDTGRLRNSISHTRDNNTAYIGTNVEYAAYVEMGTSSQRAQPYLEPAIANHLEEYKSIVEKELK